MLGAARPVTFIMTRDADRSRRFYRDVLGLSFVRNDGFADVFDVGGATLRITEIPEWTAWAHPAPGWHVPDMKAAVAELKAKGIKLIIYPGIGQDADGIWSAPDGSARVCWFNDPDGNLLSLTEN